MAPGFVRRNVEDGKYCYFYAHQNNLILERSQLLAKKEDMLELQSKINNWTIVELSTRERSSTNWKFPLATNMPFLQHCLRSFPMGEKMFCYPPRLVKRTELNCLTCKTNKECYNDNLCLIRDNYMHKTGIERWEEEISKLLNQYLDINPNVTTENFRGVAFEDLHIGERLAEVNISVPDTGLR